MKRFKLVPTIKNFRQIAPSGGRPDGEKPNLLLSALKQIESGEVVPDIDVMNDLLRVCANHSDASKAKLIHDAMHRSCTLAGLHSLISM